MDKCSQLALDNHTNTAMNIHVIKRIESIVLLFLICTVCAAQTPFECDGNIFVTIVDDQEILKIYELRENGSAAEFLQLDTSYQLNINSIGYRTTDHFIYGIDPSVHYLYQIDGEGGIDVVSFIDLVGDYFAGDISPDGQYLVLLNGNQIAKINLDDVTAPVEYVPIITADTSSTLISCTDIAFNPLTGQLFSYDGVGGRLVTIDHETGLVDNLTFEQVGYNNNIPALFFNSVGQLKGIATDNSKDVSLLFQFDLATGKADRSEFLGLLGDRDACSCPYALVLESYSLQPVVYPCTTIEYILKIGNISGEDRTDSDIYLELPEDFIIEEVAYNPFSGEQDMGTPNNIFSYTNMDIPFGVDSIVLKVTVPEDALGIYQTQPSLSGTGTISGVAELILSDYPYSFEKRDSTPISIVPLDLNSIGDGYPSVVELCRKDTLTLSFPFIDGLDYRWSTGADSTSIDVSHSGAYAITISSPCEFVEFDIEVINTDIALDVGFTQELEYGDQLRVIPNITSFSPIAEYEWGVTQGGTLDCVDCSTLFVTPQLDATYNLEITNQFGCKASDQFDVRVTRPIFAPNVFSPNFDGINDLFYLRSINPPLKVLSFGVYDRWGAKLHEASGLTDDEALGWDGVLNGEVLENGIYIWIAELEYLDGSLIQLSGDVLLLK